jgi:peptide chain release factor 1
MLEKIAQIEARYNELTRLLEGSMDDYQRTVELARERSDLEEIVSIAADYRATSERLKQARTLENSDDAGLRELATVEMEELAPRLAELERQLKDLLAPRDKRDARNVIMEIRAGAGGDEAALFAADLFSMYSRYAERRNWQVDILSENALGIGGYKEVIFNIKG